MAKLDDKGNLLNEAELELYTAEGYRLAADIIFTLEGGYTAKEVVMIDYPEEVEIPETEAAAEPEKETKKPQAEPDEPDWTYDPVQTGDRSLMRGIILMMICGAGLVVSVVLLVLNNRNIAE